MSLLPFQITHVSIPSLTARSTALSCLPSHHHAPPARSRATTRAALALCFPLRAKVVKAKSIVARKPASCRIRPRLGHESHGLPLAAEVDNGEARDHLNVGREARRCER